MYFVVAEALTNVGRYAQARRVRVTVVRDNGQGISEERILVSVDGLRQRRVVVKRHTRKW